MPKLSSSKVTLSQVNMIVSIKGKTKDKFDNNFKEEVEFNPENKFNENELTQVEFSPAKKSLIQFVIGIGSPDWYDHFRLMVYNTILKEPDLVNDIYFNFFIGLRVHSAFCKLDFL